MTRWTEREDVEQLLETFTAANPALNFKHHELRITFETSEDIMV
jgi:hypothetical protein